MAVLWGDEATVEVAAPPEHVWSLVSDVTRMGDWSPVCRKCEWGGGATAPAVGARFVGHNRMNGARWSRECVITASEPGREFAFHTLFRGRESTRWRYQFTPTETGTRVNESFEVLLVPRWIRVLRSLPPLARRSDRDAKQNIETSLARLKAGAEESRPG